MPRVFVPAQEVMHSFCLFLIKMCKFVCNWTRVIFRGRDRIVLRVIDVIRLGLTKFAARSDPRWHFSRRRQHQRICRTPPTLLPSFVCVLCEPN